MEGLLIAEVLAGLTPRLPADRRAWRFPDPTTFVLPLERGALWWFNRPPSPRVALRDDMPDETTRPTGFQALLAARAAGPLVAAGQEKLDRVAWFDFGPDEGFVAAPPVRLVAELTGRNCNLVLLDDRGVILGAAREIGAEVNRFRQIRAGLRYAPPPPYSKLDPRQASRDELREGLRGRRLRKLRGLVDGVGPDLTGALATVAGLDPNAELDGADLERLLDALERCVAEPSASLREATGMPDVAELRRRERRAQLVERLERALVKRRELAIKRIGDAERTLEAADEAPELRARADLLLAYQHTVPAGAERAEFTGFDGRPVEVAVDPARGAVGTAEQLYHQARKRERRGEQALERLDRLAEERRAAEARLARLGELDAAALEAWAEELLPRPQPARGDRPGIHYRGPHGFAVVVGRNARDNDAVTFKLARSRDLWLHAQGYPGSHVVVLAENREVPFETVIFAAQLAAAYSKAGQSDNVPVDYTLRKNVWKVKGMPPGAVHFTQQKTVYVTPDRRPEIDPAGTGESA